MVGPPEKTCPAERARPWSGEGFAERGDRLCRSRGVNYSWSPEREVAMKNKPGEYQEERTGRRCRWE